MVVSSGTGSYQPRSQNQRYNMLYISSRQTWTSDKFAHTSKKECGIRSGAEYRAGLHSRNNTGPHLVLQKRNQHCFLFLDIRGGVSFLKYLKVKKVKLAIIFRDQETIPPFIKLLRVISLYFYK